jgi:uncharacterized protein with PQ loop repeat
MLDSLGYAGTAVTIAAYLPQIWHLYRERCSAGISVRAYALWIGGSLLFLAHARNIQDSVFTLVQMVNVLALSTIVALCRRYRGQLCAEHAQLISSRPSV